MALDEYQRLGQAGFLQKCGFSKSSGFLVLDPRSRQWADSKAIAGVAVGCQYPGEGPLRADQFSGDIQTVVRRLKNLGFEVRALDGKTGEDWVRDEVELSVADYLAMLLQSWLAKLTTKRPTTGNSSSGCLLAAKAPLSLSTRTSVR